MEQEIQKQSIPSSMRTFVDQKVFPMLSEINKAINIFMKEEAFQALLVKVVSPVEIKDTYTVEEIIIGKALKIEKFPKLHSFVTEIILNSIDALLADFNDDCNQLIEEVRKNPWTFLLSDYSYFSYGSTNTCRIQATPCGNALGNDMIDRWIFALESKLALKMQTALTSMNYNDVEIQEDEIDAQRHAKELQMICQKVEVLKFLEDIAAQKPPKIFINFNQRL
jgi:hypothetical protein